MTGAVTVPAGLHAGPTRAADVPPLGAPPGGRGRGHGVITVLLGVRRAAAALVALLLLGCSATSAPTTAVDAALDGAPESGPLGHLDTVTAVAGTLVHHDFTRAGGFYRAPFPSEDMRTASGRISLAGFPNPEGIELVDQLLDVIERDARGFSLTAPLFMTLSGAPDVHSLPDITASIQDDSPVFLMDVDPDSPRLGTRYPIDTDYQADGGPFGDEHLLAALPLQGIVLRQDTRHALVVTRSLKDASGEPLGRSEDLARVLSGDPVPGLSDTARADYTSAVLQLRALGAVTPDAIAGLAVFVTGAPTLDGVQAAHALRHSAPPEVTEIAATDVYDDFCVYQGRVLMPTFQHGTPPFATAADGGGWRFIDGAPQQAGTETARVWFTVPRMPLMGSDLPTVVMIRTGGGADNPLAERGPRDAEGAFIEPGRGPALHFARAGFAGVTWDGPHGGLRNVSGGDEQFLMFNVSNVEAMRDNVRQTALEAALIPAILQDLVVDTSACPGAPGETRFRTGPGEVALFGHSMGGTVAPIALALSDRYGAAMFSGTGGSWIENVVFKQKPLEVKPLAELLVGYAGRRELHRFDPALGLLQWAAEPADPPPYGRLVTDPSVGRHLLMMQGIVDRYILPSIANTAALSMGLPLGGEALDETVAELAEHRHLRQVMPFAGLTTQSYPVSGGGPDGTTRVVTQHLEDGVEDGHEVVFQTDGPKHQYRCFLESWLATGTPTVPAPDAMGCP